MPDENLKSFNFNLLTAGFLLMWILGAYFCSFIYFLIDCEALIASRAIEIVIFFFGVCFYFFKQSKDKSLFAKSFLLHLFLLGCILLLNNNVYDLSFDGQGYHQDAILNLGQYWNYLYEDSGSIHYKWIEHYPKASWVVADFFTGLTKSIEAAKAGNLILITASFLLALDFLKRMKIKGFLKTTLAFLLAFDPINLNSFFSHTVDGQVSSMLLIVFFLLVSKEIRTSNIGKGLLIMSIIYAINLKFNSAVFIILLLFFFLVWGFSSNGIQYLKKHIAKISFAVFLGLFVFGYNPYITNIIDHQHPFYPVMGQEESIGNEYIPIPLKNTNVVSKAVKAYGSKTAFSKAFNGEIELKFPFLISKEELTTYAGTAVMIGGFGPWFSGLFLLTFALALSLIIKRKLDKAQMRILSFIAVGIFFSTLITPMNWWARFVPQLWFIIPAVIILGLSSNEKRFVSFSKVLTMVMLINSILMMGYVVYQPWATSGIKTQIKDLESDKIYPIYFGQHEQSFSKKLEKEEIQYSKLDVPKSTPILQEFKLIEAKIYAPK